MRELLLVFVVFLALGLIVAGFFLAYGLGAGLIAAGVSVGLVGLLVLGERK